MAVAVLDRFQQESKYRSCPPGQKKVAIVEGGGGGVVERWRLVEVGLCLYKVCD